jgi:hypothetical protein
MCLDRIKARQPSAYVVNREQSADAANVIGILCLEDFITTTDTQPNSCRCAKEPAHSSRGVTLGGALFFES